MCYTYDSLNRVTKRTIKNLSNVVLSEESFTYDAAGNITDAPNSCFVYDTNNRLTTFNGNTVSYDLDGNMLSNGTLTCTYDSANKLITAGGHTYTYNAEDIRIRNLCANEDTTYTYDTNCELSKLLTKTTANVTTKYIYGNGLIGEETNGSFKIYHFDFRGSTIAITNASGTITDTFAYDTYGKLISRTGTSNVIFGYNGRDGVVTDSNGLIYMRARYYSPDMRRFINADIIPGEISNAITLNRFAYANGNPISFVDPFGLSPERTGDAIWLQYSELASGAGHTGLLLQDSEGLWYLFYWGTNSPDKSIIGSNTSVIGGEKVFRKLTKYDFDLNNLYDDVMQYLSSVEGNYDPSEGLSGVMYFEGDFDKSIEYVEELVDSLSEDSNQYNLYLNNCMQVSMDALRAGTFDKYNNEYKVALAYASATIIPNDAFLGMQIFTEEIEEYMEKSLLRKFFSIEPYFGFPSYRNFFR